MRALALLLVCSTWACLCDAPAPLHVATCVFLHERGSQPGSPILHSEVIPGKPVYNIWEISHPRAYGQIFAPLGVIYDMWYVLTWPSVCPTCVLRHSVFYFPLRGLESTYIQYPPLFVISWILFMQFTNRWGFWNFVKSWNVLGINMLAFTSGHTALSFIANTP